MNIRGKTAESVALFPTVSRNKKCRFITPLLPESYETILDFMHVHQDEIDKLKDYIEWIPEPPAILNCSIQ